MDTLSTERAINENHSLDGAIYTSPTTAKPEKPPAISIYLAMTTNVRFYGVKFHHPLMVCFLVWYLEKSITCPYSEYIFELTHICMYFNDLYT